MLAIATRLEHDELCSTLSGGPIGPAGPAELHLPGGVVFGTDLLDPARRVLIEWPAAPGGAPPGWLGEILAGSQPTNGMSIDYSSLPRLDALARVAVLDEARLEHRAGDVNTIGLWSIERCVLIRATGLDLATSDRDVEAMAMLDPYTMDEWFLTRHGTLLLSLLMAARCDAADLVAVIRSLQRVLAQLRWQDQDEIVAHEARASAPLRGIVRGQTDVVTLDPGAMAWRVPLHAFEDRPVTISRVSDDAGGGPAEFRIPLSASVGKADELWARAWRRSDGTLLSLQRIVTDHARSDRGRARLSIPIDDALTAVVFEVVSDATEPIARPGGRELRNAMAHARYAAAADRLGLAHASSRRWAGCARRLDEAEAALGETQQTMSEAMQRQLDALAQLPAGQRDRFDESRLARALARRAPSAKYGAAPDAFLAERYAAREVLRSAHLDRDDRA